MTRDAHATGGARQELLYDENLPTPSHAEYARTLVSRGLTGTLSTVAQAPAGFPYGSFTTFALHRDGPVFLISELAEHTKNLRGDPRASLMVAESTAGDALANGRVTLLGQCRPVDGELAVAEVRTNYLAAHPNAAYYADFADFSLWQLVVESARYIGGYGRMSWVSAADWSAAEPDPIAVFKADIVDHMNNDHADTMVTYCRALSRAHDTSAATMTGVDRYGFEMSAVTEAGPRPIRVAFSSPISSAEEARAQMVALAKKARGHD